ncbi:MAG: oligoendopeptidase, partial [Paenibacillus sp.]|nr:oligoendopeptidase [Paenibacillus sp.]
QAANKLDDPVPAVRDRMAVKWEEAWASQADLGADTLNRLAGFRLKLYGMRGWNDPLREPLRINRMSRETLDAMWSAVEGGLEPLKRYLALKARRFGKEKLSWHDVDAPIATSQAKIPYEDAAKIITDAFEQFSPDMAKLARKAFNGQWIEAEDRTGKRPGGFCTSAPLSKQSRIFMTYSGTPGNVSTLAHELGHAYHGELVEELPPLAQDYAMNVAETASTFAEALVSDALLRIAESEEEKLALLDDRLQRAVAFCMNIRARFLFETRFYDRRAAGMLEAAELSELMVEAQKEAFGDALGSWHPHFWASKLHFYITDVPFYNFPYTFGYLFSTGLVAVAQREGAAFNKRYDDLLRDTGVMTVEQLGVRHLGVRLDQPEFWQDAVARVVADVEAFAELCKE